MTFIYIIGAIMIGASIYTFIRMIGSPKSNLDTRHKIIEEKITSIGGTVEKIETSKSTYYPYMEEINQNDGSYHVFYKVTYWLNDQHYEGWAVLKLQPSLVSPIGTSEDNWIWKIN